VWCTLGERVRILFELGRTREQIYARAEDRLAPIRTPR
jgi:hypothetical protein